MWVLAFFTHNGEPVSGLSPLARIIDVDTGLYVVFDETMVERPDGFYAYDFSTHDPTRDYAILCDSVTLSGVDRYTYSSSGEYNDVLDSIESTTGYIDIRTQLLRKIQTNRLVLQDGDTDNWTLYDDDAVTPLLTFDVTDKDDEVVIQAPHAPSQRTMAEGDICGSGIGPTADIWMRKSVYDPDEDGIVSNAEGVSDGTYSSTASGVYEAIVNMHPPYQLATHYVNEAGLADQMVLKYDAATNRLIYGPSGVSGTLSGVMSHRWLLDLDSDDHPYYVPTDGSRGFTSTVSGKDPTEPYHLTTKNYVDYWITITSGATDEHSELKGLDDDDHPQYILVDGSRGFTSTVSGIYPVADYDLVTKDYVDNSVKSDSDWQNSVIEERTGGPPGSPSDGDRYLVTSGTGDWDGCVGCIVEWDDYNNEWDFYGPDEGSTVFNEDINSTQIYHGGEWVDLASTLCHSELQCLDADDHPQYILVDGSRGFTSTVSGIDPTDPQHLTTKQYVDTQISGVNNIINELYALVGENKSGVEELSIYDTETSVSFASSFSDIDYALVLSLENTADSPSSEYSITITEKSLTGFKVHYSGEMDSNNYYLNWYATLSGGVGSTEGDGCTCSGYLKAVEEDPTPVLGGDLFVGNHGYELDVTPSGHITHGYLVGYSGEISTMYVERNDNGIGTPFYMKTNSYWYQCTAISGSTQMPCAAMALEEGTGMKKIMWQGIIRKGSWSWTPGDIIFVSTVDAALTNTEPTEGAWVQPVGIAIASDTIRFDPGFYRFYVGYP